MTSADRAPSARPINTFSPFVAACFTLNYVMGTGILALPWAFHEAGAVISILSLVFVCVVGTLSCDYLLSAMARAETLMARRTVNDHEESTPIISLSSSVASPSSSSSSFVLIVRDRKFELNELCRLFLGRKGELAYMVCIALYLYGLLWAYSTVFGNSMARSLPIPGLDSDDCYAVYVGVFSLIALPLSFLELPEQVRVQIFLSVCRFVMVIIMVVTPLVWDTDDPHSCTFGGMDADGEDDLLLWNIAGVGRMLPIVVFSVIFHHSIPGLAKEATDRRNVHRVFGVTLVMCTAAYSVIGTVCSWRFGKDVEQSVNLNWSLFKCNGGKGVFGLFAKAVSFYTVVFPSLDVMSAFPLNAIVLSNSLLTALQAGAGGGGVVNESRFKNALVRNFVKLVSCVPPLLGALFVSDLGTVTDFTGLPGFLLGFCFPPLLYVISERTLAAAAATTTSTTRTRYERTGSSVGSATVVFVLGIAFLSYTCYQYVSEVETYGETSPTPAVQNSTLDH